MNILEWKNQYIKAPKKAAIPVLSFPCISLLDCSVKELVNSSDMQAAGLLSIADRCPTGASVSFMDLSIEAEAFGATIRFSDNEVPTIIGNLVKEPADAEALSIPEIGAGRTKLNIEAIKKTVNRLTDRPVFAGAIGPFSLTGRLMGMTELMINCYEEPEMVETVLEKTTEFIIKYISAYKSTGCAGVVLAEPAAGIISNNMMAEFSAPYVKRIIDAVQDENFGIIYHNCGNAALTMTEVISGLGAIGYHFGDAVNMQQICEKMPKDVLVMGNISPSEEFFGGTPESIRETTLELLNKCSKYPNFIISSGCDIPPATPWKNIDSFFKAVQDFYK